MGITAIEQTHTSIQCVFCNETFDGGEIYYKIPLFGSKDIIVCNVCMNILKNIMPISILCAYEAEGKE